LSFGISFWDLPFGFLLEKGLEFRKTYFQACIILLSVVGIIATFIACFFIKKKESMARLFTLQISLILVFSFLSLHLLSQNDISFPVAVRPEAPATLLFDYPTEVDAGDAFVLTCTIKKNRPTAGSTLTFITVPGFAVQPFTLAGAEIGSSGNKTTLSWKAIIENPQISFSIKVAVRDLRQGVYPLITAYSDSHGYRNRQALRIYVDNPSPKREYVADPFAGKNPYTLTLLHPETVKPKEEFDIKMQLAKGKNTGAAFVMLKVPSASSITLDGYPEAFFENGLLMADIPMMPSSPAFEITARVTNDAQRMAVYPILASVTYNDGFTTSWKGFLYTEPENAKSKFIKAPLPKSNIDTTTVFSRIDSLLNAWTATVPAVKSQPQQLGKQQATVTESTTQPAAIASEERPETDVFKDEIPQKKFYSIQIAASKVPLDNMKSFLQSMGVQHIMHEEYDSTFYRYFVGEFDTADWAKGAVAQIAGMGFPEAFVVLFDKGKRVKRIN
jgi:hypothetical protein